MTRGTRLGTLRVWAALVVAALGAAIVVTMIGVALDDGMAAAATGTRATIEATQFTVEPGLNDTGEASAVCPGDKRALGGGVVQSGSADSLWMHASGPLDSTGFTSETRDGDIAKQWYAAVKNNAGDVTRTLKVFGICE